MTTNTSPSPTPVSDEQIAKWKQQHQTVYAIEVASKIGYFKVPDRNVISYAMSQAPQNPLGYYEAIAQNTFLGGDQALLEDDSYFLSICNRLSELVQVKEAQLKKC